MTKDEIAKFFDPCEKTTEMKTEQFIIMAHRSGTSVFGGATRPLKNAQNEVMTFDSQEEATKHKDQLMADLKTSNVYYTVEEVSHLAE